MKTTLAYGKFFLLIIAFASGPVRTITAITRNQSMDTGLLSQKNDYDAISVKDLVFVNGIKSIDVLSITSAKIKQLLGKPKKIEKGYSELDDDQTVSYFYPDGEIMFFVKQKFWYIEAKGPGWAFGIKDKQGKVSKFTPGDSLNVLKILFPVSYQDQINSTYINIGIKTPSGIDSDSCLSFEVDKSNSRIASISLN